MKNLSEQGDSCELEQLHCSACCRDTRQQGQLDRREHLDTARPTSLAKRTMAGEAPPENVHGLKKQQLCMEKHLGKLTSSTELWSFGGCVWLGVL